MPNLPPEAMLSDLMSVALDEAGAALAHDDVPVGAVVARIADGLVVASAHNEKELRGDATAHAEVLALQAASQVIGGWRLGGHALISTIEPCPMCAGAALAARVDLVVFGAADPRAGAAGSLYNLAADPRLNHEIPVVPGVHAEACAALVERFFAARRP
ncbi:MAG: tRNA(adenine34) deaminase [Actinomycetota bacterium]|jgi:tRNA(adenine34) deaminase|nr:tRNA(adenine34) deaminase [Actinomycetota bacterium]